MLESIENIIVPTDFSERSEVAIRSAATLARDANATIHLLHVIRLPVFHTTYDINIPARVWEGLRNETTQLMDETCDRLSAMGVTRVEREISEYLHPAKAVEEKIREVGADLVVMATHGRRGIQHAFLGSVTEETLRSCPVPVLAVKEQGIGDTPIRRILVAVDFSTGSERAIELAVSLAQRSGASIDLIHVVDEIPDYALYATTQILEIVQEARTALGDRLEAVGEELAKRGLSIRTHLETGSPSEVIAEQAKNDESDLIVMGTHGHRGFVRFALGSVAERTLRLAPCSVLTTRVESADG